MTLSILATKMAHENFVEGSASYILTFHGIDTSVDGKPLPRAGYYVDYNYCHLKPLPIWGNIKYGIFTWNMYKDGAAK